MEQYLITQTLLSSWQYLFDCYEGCEEDAAAEFLSTLERAKKEPTEAMQNGIEFENNVYAAAAGMRRNPHPKWETGIQQIAPILKGAPVQVRLQRTLDVDGMSFLCYGILDAMKAGTIYDVKFSNKSLGSIEAAGKYLESAQHPMYFYLCPEAREFKYLLSDGQDLYIEAYDRDGSRDIREIIHSFLVSLKEMGLDDTYRAHWKAL
jgi:hypothetical protein